MTEALQISTGEAPGPFDGLESAKPDEPVFTLQGGDPLASGLVKQWAHERRAETARKLTAVGITEAEVEALKEDLRRCSQAEEIAWAMDEYRRGGGVVTKAKQDRYSGWEETKEDEAVRERGAVLATAKHHVNEATSYVNDAAQLLRNLDEPPIDIARRLDAVVGKLKLESERIAPCRVRRPKKRR